MGKARALRVIMENHFDRLAETKLTHAYHILFPAKNIPVHKSREDSNKESIDEDDSYICEGLL